MTTLTPQQSRIMRVLKAHYPGEVELAVISEWLGITPANVKAQVWQMRQRGAAIKTVIYNGGYRRGRAPSSYRLASV